MKNLLVKGLPLPRILYELSLDRQGNYRCTGKNGEGQ